MTTIKTIALAGAALDWAVAKCEEKGKPAGYRTGAVERGNFAPSTNWGDGGPILEREINKVFKNVGGTYTAQIRHEESHPLVAHPVLSGWTHAAGPTPLIAAMRAYVANKLGDTVDVPEELA